MFEKHPEFQTLLIFKCLIKKFKIPDSYLHKEDSLPNILINIIASTIFIVESFILILSQAIFLTFYVVIQSYLTTPINVNRLN